MPNPPPDLAAVLERHPAKWTCCIAQHYAGPSFRCVVISDAAKCVFMFLRAREIGAETHLIDSDLEEADALCRLVNTLAAQQPAADGKANPLNFGSCVHFAVTGKPLPLRDLLATFAEESNWTRIYDAAGVHYAWIGPWLPPFEWPQRALAESGQQIESVVAQQPAAPPARTDAERIAWLMRNRIENNGLPYLTWLDDGDCWHVAEEIGLGHTDLWPLGDPENINPAARAIIDAAMDAGAREEDGR